MANHSLLELLLEGLALDPSRWRVSSGLHYQQSTDCAARRQKDEFNAG
ncbi:hypothetical protein [Pseudomonas sp. LFM046]|nr:hypothetical protein [Pseudomonas sp. LFM046]